MGMSAFNRHRRQAEALADAQARDDAEQQKPITEKYSDEEIGKFAENNDLMGSPPYADVAALINIPADADPDREKAAMEQALKNRERVPTDEDRWQLQNSHFRDQKVKAIPDFDEAGQDRTLKGQEGSRRKASEPYEDPRSPKLDGRERSAEPWEERPDSDTTVSGKTRQKATPPVLDDDPALIEKIVDKGEKPTEVDVPEQSMSPVVPAPEPPAPPPEQAPAAAPEPVPEPAPGPEVDPASPEDDDAKPKGEAVRRGRPAKSQAKED